MTDDGRFLVLLATLGVAGVAVARGSRGVVRRGRGEGPRGPRSWSVPYPLLYWSGGASGSGRLQDLKTRAWFTRLPNRKVAFAWPVMLGADPDTDMSSYARMAKLVPPSTARIEEGLSTAFGNGPEQAAAARWRAEQDKAYAYDPDHEPGDGSRYSFAIDRVSPEKSDVEQVLPNGQWGPVAVDLLWSLLPFRRRMGFASGALEFRAMVVDPGELPAADYLADKLGLSSDALAERAASMLQEQLS